MGDEGADRICDRSSRSGPLLVLFFRLTPYNSGNEPSNAGMKAMQRTATRKAPLPGAVWALGLKSLFMDFSSEMIHGLLPVFLVLNLGASAAVL